MEIINVSFRHAFSGEQTVFSSELVVGPMTVEHLRRWYSKTLSDPLCILCYMLQHDTLI